MFPGLCTRRAGSAEPGSLFPQALSGAEQVQESRRRCFAGLLPVLLARPWGGGIQAASTCMEMRDVCLGFSSLSPGFASAFSGGMVECAI